MDRPVCIVASYALLVSSSQLWQITAKFDEKKQRNSWFYTKNLDLDVLFSLLRFYEIVLEHEETTMPGVYNSSCW